MFIPFIDILYSLAIGTGFVYFPENPLNNIAGAFAFMFSLFIAGHDWYEYHDKAEIIPKERELLYHVWQAFVVLVLNQMFRHSVESSLQSWLIYFGIFATLNAVWNAFTKFVNHWLFVGTTSIVAIGSFTAGFFYNKIIVFLPNVDGRWLILFGELLLIVLVLQVIRVFNK